MRKLLNQIFGADEANSVSSTAKQGPVDQSDEDPVDQSPAATDSAPPVPETVDIDPHLAPFIGVIPSLTLGELGNTELVDYFFDLASHFEPNVFCDIGANTGETARRMAAEHSHCTVFGFEANSSIYETHKATVEEAGVNFQNIALGNTDGTVEIFIPTKLSRAFIDGELHEREIVEAPTTGKSSLLQRNEDAEYKVESVTAKRLDSVLELQENDSVFLWIDVEGAAQLVLDGASETLKQTDCIFIEIEGYQFWKSTNLSSPIQTLIESGFTPVLRDREYHDAQFNVVFVKNDLVAEAQMVPPASGQDDETNAETKAADVPILIPTFNNPTFADFMVKQLIGMGFADIRLFDNASTSESMKRWLAEIEPAVTVVRLDENLGPRNSIFRPEVLETLPRHFVVTDPDMELSKRLPTNFLDVLIGLTNRHKVGKAGLALDISERRLLNQDDYQIGDRTWKIWEWEEKFWHLLLEYTTAGEPVFRASVDTTFALYDQDFFDSEKFLNGVRVGGRFTAKHLPWYQTSRIPQQEEAEYRSSQKFSFYFPNTDGDQ